MERSHLKGKTHAELMLMLEQMLWPERFGFAAKLDQAIKKQEAAAKQREFLLEKASKMWGGQVHVLSHGVFKR